MKTKGQKQSKAMQCIIGAPLRVLAKAGDFYMRSMMDCSGGVGYGGLVGCPALQVSRLPRSVSVGSPKRRDGELMGRVSKRSNGGSKVEMERCNGVGMRSYSTVGIGKIGRIDEEKPCEFVEDYDGKHNPRSRTCAAVTRRNTNAVFL